VLRHGILRVIVAAVVLLFACPAFACLKGDVEDGPNCVSATATPSDEFTAFEGVVTMTWVYRLINGLPVTVWRGLGKVTQSTREKLRVHVRFTPKSTADGEPRKPVDYEYDLLWDGKGYSRSGFRR
jgi:hypothetical protein